jgi:hypothetical protein
VKPIVLHTNTTETGVTRGSRQRGAKKNRDYWIFWLFPIVTIRFSSSTRIQTVAPGLLIELTASRPSSSSASEVVV